jgi:glycerol-3-phosphate dehydrogenase
VLLVEARDFAWGTSSRSSKLVHGGLRYLKEGKPHLTWESVRERDQLMREVPGLVDPIGFVMSHHKGRKPGRSTMRIGLALYDLFAGHRSSGWASTNELQLLAPGLQRDGLSGASLYLDATTDDARLVLRVLDEAVAFGATVINYLDAQALLRDENGQVNGAQLMDSQSGASYTVRANCVIAATGVWADQLRSQLGEAPKLRPLRGSHLLLPAWRLPLARAVAFLHPIDQRPVFAYPWQGCTLVGTTDLDHADLATEPAISNTELNYLLDALNGHFPALSANAGDVISTWAGVRPVIDSGKELAPSQESRDHLVLNEHGLISVTGGKLTTFRRIAQDTLKHAASRLPNLRAASDDSIIPRAPAPSALQRLPSQLHARLCGRYGARLGALLDGTGDAELALIPGTSTLHAELRWAARHEQVIHLDDLLLRRTRLGLTQRNGAAALLSTLQAMLSEELGWNDKRWQQEVSDYQALIKRCYSLPLESRR